MSKANAKSVLVLDPGKKADVLISLLKRNREEITFWQNSLFTARSRPKSQAAEG